MDINKWNENVLKSKGIKQSGKAPSIVRSVGDAKRATLWDGTVVERTDAIFVDGYGLVKTIDSELHFVYAAPKTHKGWGLWCSCGSIAGVVGYSAYSKLASPMSDGKIIACIRLLTTKQNTGIATHADNSTE